MPKPPEINSEFLLDNLRNLLETPSPTGFAHRAIAHVREKLKLHSDLTLSETRKGAFITEWPGEKKDTPRGITSHVAVALIGPGVDASHNYERTHLDALMVTARWISAYLLN